MFLQSGNTPLTYCAMMNAGPEIVAALWDAGADDSLVNKVRNSNIFWPDNC